MCDVDGDLDKGGDLITDAPEFLRRAQRAVDREKLTLKYGSIEYVERESHHGPMGPFRKFSDYKKQSEFRLHPLPEIEPVRILDLGSLEDIATMCQASEPLRVTPATRCVSDRHATSRLLGLGSLSEELSTSPRAPVALAHRSNLSTMDPMRCSPSPPTSACSDATDSCAENK